ncbi:MAG: helix-turn-helix transcriptional regulator [Candidatus Omnitrophica bacterium]|nr:helix-turn-helix transcriptional regulator [Candidatus Omnitrophota bacterium]
MLAKNIRRIRLRKGLSQEKLARLAEIALNTLAKIESGRSKEPTIGTITRVARALGVSLDELVKGKKSDPILN